MKNMMGALLQCVVHSCLAVYLTNRPTPSLKDMSGPKQVTPTTKERLHELCEKTAEDIKGCANTCDVYAK